MEESLRNPTALLANKTDEDALSDVIVETGSKKLRHDEVSDSGSDGDAASKLPYHNSDIEKEQKPAMSDSMTLKKPLLLGIYNARAVMLLLNLRPSKDGWIFIRYEDNGQDEEVEISRVCLNLLTAAS